MKHLFLAAIALVLVAVCTVNRASVAVDLFPLPYSFDVPLFILILLSTAAGIIISGTIFTVKLIKNKFLIKNLQKRLSALENENKALHSESAANLPILK